ncbi:MAG: hypothetical protein LBL00_02525, partial [Endomicrobium sp.]|nr:hypothetical protein [Endomicrobium sp.]
TPTRQSLVYLPFFVYVIAQSLNQIKEKYILIGMGVYLSVFLYFLPGFLKERQDKIDAPKLTQTIRQYNPDLIIGYDYTLHANLFKEIRTRYNYFDTENLILNKSAVSYKTIAFLSTRKPLDQYSFQQSQILWNNKTTGAKSWSNTYNQYKTIYEIISTSDIEIEPNNWNTNGRNNLFFYILSL